MKWIKLRCLHFNTSHLDEFFWDGGYLYLLFSHHVRSIDLEDPDGKLYRKLCAFLGVTPAEVTENGKG